MGDGKLPVMKAGRNHKKLRCDAGLTRKVKFSHLR